MSLKVLPRLTCCWPCLPTLVCVVFWCMGFSSKALGNSLSKWLIRMLGVMLILATDKVRERIRYGSLRLYMMFLPLPIPNFIMRLQQFEESQLHSISERGSKRLLLSLSLSIKKKIPITAFPWKLILFWAYFCGQRNAIYQLTIACILKLTPRKFLKISCLHEPSGDLAKIQILNQEIWSGVWDSAFLASQETLMAYILTTKK